jgi:ribonuclease HI
MNAYAWIGAECHGNPGPAAVGVVLRKATGELITTASEFLGRTTRNAADYQALIAALGLAKRFHVKRLVVYTDSVALLGQMDGVLKGRAKHLEPLIEMAGILIKSYEDFRLISIDKERNLEAGTLALRAIDGGQAAAGGPPKAS